MNSLMFFLLGFVVGGLWTYLYWRDDIRIAERKRLEDKFNAR